MARPAPSRPGDSLIAIDLLRFTCAMGVLVFHYGGLLPGPASPLSDAVNAGWIGVELFFVVSGYAIAASARDISPARFLHRRALRLLPAAWLCASLTAVTLLAAGALPPETIVRRWLASLAFDPLSPAIDPSYWTLGIEVAFYLAIAAVIARTRAPDALPRFAVALGCASATYWLPSLVVDVPPPQNRLVQLLLLPHGCFFAIGMLLRARPSERVRSAETIAIVPLIAVGAIEIAGHTREFGMAWPVMAWALALFGAGLLPILFADRLQPRLRRRIPIGVSITLGLTTYPIYLLHQGIGRVVVAALVEAGGSPAIGVAIATTIVLVLAYAVATHAEPWLRAALNRLSRPRVRAPDSRPTASPSAG